MKELPYKHYFTVKNGEYAWEEPQMFQIKKTMLEGKRGFAIIEEETERTTSSQLAYYFGGIIRQECMNSECFAGMTEKEIHDILLTEVAGTMRKVYHPASKIHRMMQMPGDFEQIMNSKKKMSDYLEKVIAKLETEYYIYPKPSEHYKTNIFRIKTKKY